MGVPYADAWGIPVDMALDMLGVTPTGSKSKHSAAHTVNNANKPLPLSLVNTQATAAASNAPRKMVAARRKSQSSPDKNIS